ncbi:MAG TPA: type II secretion system F family protein [Candidatus Sulfotelmatobacter sp.]|nr:type II secretion system F family protein [Candidatus Sulfotelmatobacter sp.]
MPNYAYVAIDPQGDETHGTLDVFDQSEALSRIKQMGLFPTKVLAENRPQSPGAGRRSRPVAIAARLPRRLSGSFGTRFGSPVKPGQLAAFTRQLATLVEAGMPLLRSLRTLHEQEENRAFKRVIEELATSIESGSSFAEAVADHPRVFNRLYINMVKAGEIGGALESSLNRLAEFSEKAQKIKGKVKAAMVYPCTVLLVACGIVGLLMVYVVPRFREVFAGLLNGARMPAFTTLVMNLSELVRSHLWVMAGMVGMLALGGMLALQTHWGRWCFDRLKLGAPVLGPVFRKVAISRFSRTLGTLVSNGVPILQALTIVKETTGNVIVGSIVAAMHERVKEGDPMAPTLKACPVFPAMVAGMVDVGEQTGALPEMLLKIADNYDEEVDNAVSAMTSLLEPIMIVFLAVVVGSIVIALFLPLVTIIMNMDGPAEGNGRGE